MDGLYNGLAPNRQPTIIWTSGGLEYWRMDASLGLNELTIKAVGKVSRNIYKLTPFDVTIFIHQFYHTFGKILPCNLPHEYLDITDAY